MPRPEDVNGRIGGLGLSTGADVLIHVAFGGAAVVDRGEMDDPIRVAQSRREGERALQAAESRCFVQDSPLR